jgi:hypothetical protein
MLKHLVDLQHLKPVTVQSSATNETFYCLAAQQPVIYATDQQSISLGDMPLFSRAATCDNCSCPAAQQSEHANIQQSISMRDMILFRDP